MSCDICAKRILYPYKYQQLLHLINAYVHAAGQADNSTLKFNLPWLLYICKQKYYIKVCCSWLSLINGMESRLEQWNEMDKM